ncbi:hypothetical protein ABZV93_11965 [Actinopolymorpha sp. NPDC004070]|uniref:hypothetical protein n=1 Tax=Actinopolymorpha sp. NPDC004070 TaxID=3154548 RepID=UPI0033A14377
MTHDQVVALCVVGAAVVLYLFRDVLKMLVLYAVVVAVVVAAVTHTDGLAQVVAIAALPVAWFGWVLLFPYATCRVCKGKGFFTTGPYHRLCPKCNGGKSKQRFTASSSAEETHDSPGRSSLPRQGTSTSKAAGATAPMFMSVGRRLRPPAAAPRRPHGGPMAGGGVCAGQQAASDHRQMPVVALDALQSAARLSDSKSL